MKNASTLGNKLLRVIDILKELPRPDDCSQWNKCQTFETIAPHTIEEVYEVARPISSNEMGNLKEELGDLLYQVIYHCEIASELGHFNFDEVVDELIEKTRRRHANESGQQVMGGLNKETSNWEITKKRERDGQELGMPTGDIGDVFRGIPITLPSLSRAKEIQARAAAVGFDWPTIKPIFNKIAEEMNELNDEVKSPICTQRLEEELGDVLFTVVNLARHLAVDPEKALRKANDKFINRFKIMEQEVDKKSIIFSELSSSALNQLWEYAKKK